MKAWSLNLLILVSYLTVLAWPVYAASTGGSGGSGTDPIPTIPSNPTIMDLAIIVQRLISFLIAIVGSISVLMIVIGGFRYIVSSGDPKATQSARHTITFALLGLVIVLLAVSMVILIGNITGTKGLDIVKFESGNPSQFQR